MKLAYFNDFNLGIIENDYIFDVSEMVHDIPHLGPHDLIKGLIERWAEYKDLLGKASILSKKIPLAKVHLRAPLPKPGKIICMARNFMDSQSDKPEPLNAFLKSPSAITGPETTITLPNAPAAIFEHEAELAIVIGKRASNINSKNAYQHIFGYVNFMDISARGLAVGNLATDTFFPGKSWHTFAPIGPYIVTEDEVENPQALDVKLWVNRRLRQDYSMQGMNHTIAKSIEWVSTITPLEPGDVFCCGTNHTGLGPLQNGDTVEMEIEGLGKLCVHVRDPLKRTWPPLTRAEKVSLKGTGETE